MPHPFHSYLPYPFPLPPPLILYNPFPILVMVWVCCRRMGRWIELAHLISYRKEYAFLYSRFLRPTSSVPTAGGGGGDSGGATKEGVAQVWKHCFLATRTHPTPTHPSPPLSTPPRLVDSDDNILRRLDPVHRHPT